MQRILIFHPYLAPYRVDLYNRLSELFDVRVLLTGGIIEKSTLGFNLKLINNQAKFGFIYKDKGLYLGRHLISLIYYRQIKAFRPDYVFAHELGINTFAAIILKPFYKYRLFVTIDDSPSILANYSWSRKKLQRFVVRYTNAMLVVHPEVKKHLENEYLNRTKCKFIYFPIIQDESILRKKLANTSLEMETLIKSHNLVNKKVLLFVGRLEKVKSPEILIQAVEILKQEDIILVIVGSGSMEQELRDYVCKNGLINNILFTGQLSGNELYAWYRIAKVLILPSKHEPFGAVVNEALVAGCKVIVSNNVGANCLIDSTNGKVIKKIDANKLAKEIKNILQFKNIKKDDEVYHNRMPISFEEIFQRLTNLID